MKKSIGKNYIYNLLYEVVSLLVPLITIPYTSKVLGADKIGLYSYTYSIVTYFTYFAVLGTTVYARREIAYNQDNLENRTQLFWEIILLRIINATISIIVYFLYVINYSYNIISIIQGMYIIVIITDITWIFQGMEDFGTIVLRNIIVKIISVIFIFAFVKSSSDFIMYLVGLILFSLVGNLFLWKNLCKYIGKPFGLKLKPFKHIKGSIMLFIPTIASQVYLQLDKTMIGIFTNTNIENGYYEQAQKIIIICATILTTFGTVMAPKIASAYVR